MQGIQPSLSDHRKNIILFQEQLATRIEGNAMIRKPRLDILCPLHDQ
jgi:hypothetical protein